MWQAAIPAAVQVVGDIVGGLQSQGDRDRGNQAMQQAFDIINSIGAPPDLSKEIIFKQFQSAGILTPELEKQIDIGISQVSQISEDQDLRDAQKQSLRLLQERGKVGLTPEEKADMSRIRSEAQKDIEAKRQQILQGMQQRGLAGSGAELAAQLSESQAGANRESDASLQLGSLASQRALQAMADSGTLAGTIRAKDFDINKAKAQAADEFKRFQVSQDILRQTRNIGALNKAQISNLENKQDIMNVNTAMYNKEKLRQNEAKRQYWKDQIDIAKLLSGAKTSEGEYYSNKANDIADRYGKIGAGVSKGLGSYMSAQQSSPSARASSDAEYEDLLDQARYKRKAKQWENFSEGDS